MSADLDNSNPEPSEGILSADESSAASRQLAEWIVRLRWPMLAAAVVLAILAWKPGHRVQFDRSIENMFAPNDPLLPPYDRLKQQFGGNEIVMAVYTDPQLLAEDGSGMAQAGCTSASK